MLLKYPTRSRPDLFRRTLGLYLQDPTAYVLVGIDRDDASMCNEEMLVWLAKQSRVGVAVGDSKSKVEAVNSGLTNCPWEGIICIGSDDMIPQCPDYAQRITGLYEEFFPEGDGVLHLNDGRVGKRLNTLPILDRRYYDRFGFVYNPAYKSTWVDNEFHEVSERLGRAVYVNECIIAHDWIGEMQPDQLHRYNESFDAVDAATFKHRQAAGFPNTP